MFETQFIGFNLIELKLIKQVNRVMIELKLIKKVNRVKIPFKLIVLK